MVFTLFFKYRRERECPGTRESKRSKDKSIKYYRSKMIRDDLSVYIGDISVSF